MTDEEKYRPQFAIEDPEGNNVTDPYDWGYWARDQDYVIDVCDHEQEYEGWRKADEELEHANR